QWQLTLELCDQVLPTRPTAPIPTTRSFAAFCLALAYSLPNDRPTDRPTAPGLNTRWGGMGWDGTGHVQLYEVSIVCVRTMYCQSLLSRCRHVVTLG
ncbi:hypothetical protein CORC01_01358, partial [Colletotrichum orchidophilum]